MISRWKVIHDNHHLWAPREGCSEVGLEPVWSRGLPAQRARRKRKPEKSAAGWKDSERTRSTPPLPCVSGIPFWVNYNQMPRPTPVLRTEPRPLGFAAGPQLLCLLVFVTGASLSCQGWPRTPNLKPPSCPSLPAAGSTGVPHMPILAFRVLSLGLASSTKP